MVNVLKLCLLFFLLKYNLYGYAQRRTAILSVPARQEYTQVIKGGNTVLPSGRLLTPAGQTIQITHDPFGLAVSPDGQTSVTLHNGVFTIINNHDLQHTRVP